MAGTANAVNGPEAAPYVAKAGGTMTGALILNTSSPSTDLQAASKGYVDAVAQGLNVLAACRLATTTALTVTYDNVSAPPSGVGATLTNAGAMAALSIDGVATAVGNRILVKNQASALQNGIYTVTDIGSGATNWVMTRATDYDLPADINPGDFVLIDFGTANSGSGWIQTATVASIGVDSINFSRFGAQNAINKVVQQVFTSNGTYTPTSGMVYCIIECVGGGGGSGGGSGAAGQVVISGSGGGGEYSRSIKTAADIGTSQAVTIGAGGTAGASGNNNGGDGGTTSVGALVTALGGGHGNGDTSTATTDFGGTPGQGGSGGTGDFKIRGGSGQQGLVTDGANGYGTPAPGGSSYFSNGQNDRGASNGLLYGGGASGVFNDSASQAGAVGGAGVVVITEFCSVTS